MQIPVTVARQVPGQLLIQWPDGAFPPSVEIYWSHRPESAAGEWERLVTITEETQVTMNDPSPGSRPYFLLASAGDGAVIVAERRLPLEGSPNFRDLGGYLAEDGRSVRWGQLYRSGGLGRLTDDDLAYLQSLGLKVVCDFRSEFEAEQSPGRRPNGPTLLSLPIAGGDVPMAALYQAVENGDFSELDGEHLIRANRMFVREFTPTYAEMLDRAAREDGRPALIHCTAGKDRTGLGSAILLWVLGVPMKTVFADYLLTNEYNAQRNKMMLGQLRQAIAGKNGVAPESVDLSPMVALTTAKRDYLQAAVDSITADYGSIDSYIHDGLGISERVRRRFQDAMLG
jgi:protein-tyrosine phosphatase